MNHRRHKAMRFEKLLWITKEPEGIGFLSNKYILLPGFLACISSRITTVIQVVMYYQINDNWFNEPFAVSLYRLLILRHAWLNLWDKHMTTGRINQITTTTPKVRVHKWTSLLVVDRTLTYLTRLVCSVPIRLPPLSSSATFHTGSHLVSEAWEEAQSVGHVIKKFQALGHVISKPRHVCHPFY